MRYGPHAFDCKIKVFFMPTINLIFYFVVLQGGFPLCRFINLQFLHEGGVCRFINLQCVKCEETIKKEKRFCFNYVSLIK